MAQRSHDGPVLPGLGPKRGESGRLRSDDEIPRWVALLEKRFGLERLGKSIDTVRVDPNVKDR